MNKLKPGMDGKIMRKAVLGGMADGMMGGHASVLNKRKASIEVGNDERGNSEAPFKKRKMSAAEMADLREDRAEVRAAGKKKRKMYKESDLEEDRREVREAGKKKRKSMESRAEEDREENREEESGKLDKKKRKSMLGGKPMAGPKQPRRLFKSVLGGDPMAGPKQPRALFKKKAGCGKSMIGQGYKKKIKLSGTFEGKSNRLGQGGRAAQLRAQGVPGGVIGNLARAAHAAPGQKNYHKSK